MQVDGISVSLSPREFAALVRSLPLPKGMEVSEVALTDAGMEATVKASFLLGLPVKFKVEVDHFSGSKLYVKVSPPVKPNWLLVRPMVLAIPGARYMGQSVLEVDLVSASRGYLTGITLRKLSVTKGGFLAEAVAVSSAKSWEDLLAGISW